MDYIAMIFGGVLGALLGTCITDFERDQPFQSVSRRQNLIRCFILIIPIWIIAAICIWRHRDVAGWRLTPQDFVVGTLIGFAAAPWLWLHFSKSISVESSAKDGEATKGGEFGRYQLLSIILGVALFVAVLLPQLGRLLPGGSKIEGFGMSVSLPERTGVSAGSTVVPLTSSTGSFAKDKLTELTHYAATIGNKTPNRRTATSNLPVLSGFGHISLVDRDKAYMAFILHSMSLKTSPIAHDAYKTLQDQIKSYATLPAYIDAAKLLETTDPTYESDLDFVQWTAPLFACLDTYAETMNDSRLYFLEISDFLEAFVALLKGNDGVEGTWNDNIKKTWSEKRREDFKSLCDNLLYKLDSFLSGMIVNENSYHCKDHLLEMPHRMLGGSPYPAMLAAYSLAAVESPESALLNISDWVKIKDSRAVGVAPPARLRWLLLRARLTISKLTAQDLRSRVPPGNFANFQREITDELGEILGFNSPESFKQFCDGIKGDSINDRLGRYLALQYATERSYLFQLEEPGLIDRWRRDDGLRFQKVKVDLQEAESLADNRDCYKDVPTFADKGEDGEHLRDHFLGQFKLDVAQLRLGLATSISQRESDKEVKVIQDVLARAKELLEPTPPLPQISRTFGPAEALLWSDNFEDQRARLAQLQSSLPQ